MVIYGNDLDARLKAGLCDALAGWFSITEAECPVLKGGQPVVATAKRCVTFTKISSVRLGVQGVQIVDDGVATGGFNEIPNWVEEITWQINVRTKELATDGVGTPTAKDIADGIASWICSWRGLENFRNRGLHALQVGSVRLATSTDESDLFQNTASFDCTFHVGQSRVLAVVPRQDPELVLHGV